MNSKIHRIECEEPWFSLIQAGIKPVEGRKNSPKYQNLKTGDVIEFYLGEKKFQAIIIDIVLYSSLEGYLHSVKIENALPGVQTFEEALRIYHQWNSPEEIARWGFLGIFVRPI